MKIVCTAKEKKCWPKKCHFCNNSPDYNTKWLRIKKAAINSTFKKHEQNTRTDRQTRQKHRLNTQENRQTDGEIFKGALASGMKQKRVCVLSSMLCFALLCTLRGFMTVEWSGKGSPRALLPSFLPSLLSFSPLNIWKEREREKQRKKRNRERDFIRLKQAAQGRTRGIELCFCVRKKKKKKKKKK